MGFPWVYVPRATSLQLIKCWSSNRPRQSWIKFKYGNYFQPIFQTSLSMQMIRRRSCASGLVIYSVQQIAPLYLRQSTWNWVHPGPLYHPDGWRDRTTRGGMWGSLYVRWPFLERTLEWYLVEAVWRVLMYFPLQWHQSIITENTFVPASIRNKKR